MALQVQWGLEQTSYNTLGAIRGVVQAASTDNVQAAAIMACEGFGATITMCPNTRLKIEQTVCSAPEPAIIGFLKVSVGYSAGDSVSQLSKSLAGVQFLALAAALTTLEPNHVARAVHAMIEASAADKTLIPTWRHTMELLKAIRGRCLQARFAEDVAGWHLVLEKTLLAKGVYTIHGQPRVLHALPNDNLIEKLVDSLRQIRRIGDSDIMKVRILVGACASWVIAFVKWCLGRPPTVMLDDGTILFDQADSEIEVVIPGYADARRFSITLLSSRVGLSTLVATESEFHSFFGMVSVRTYGQLLLRSYDSEDVGISLAIQEALPYALYGVRDYLVVLADDLDPSMGFKRGSKPIDITGNTCKTFNMSPFPDGKTIWATYAELFGFHKSGQAPTLPKGVAILELPVISDAEQRLMERCPCSRCCAQPEGTLLCFRDRFIDGMVACVASILVISLFESSHDLLCSTKLADALRFPNGRFISAIESILRNSTEYGCSICNILSTAYAIVGHKIPKEKREKPYIMSSDHGQVVWPAIYQEISFHRFGFLRLLWLRGNLRYHGDTYSSVTTFSGLDLEFPAGNTSLETTSAYISRPLNSYTAYSLNWKVTVLDGGLQVAAEGHFGGEIEWVGTFDPTNVLASLAEALYVDECAHSPYAELVYPETDCKLLSPAQSIKDWGSEERQRANRIAVTDAFALSQFLSEPGPGAVVWDNFGKETAKRDHDTGNGQSGSKRKVAIMPVAGNDSLRFVSLGKNTDQLRVVLRGDACLSCCLDVCRRSGYATLIL